MTSISRTVLFNSLMWVTAASAWAANAPQISVQVDNLDVTVSWDAGETVDQFILYYAPWPKATPINNIPLENQRSLSVTLPSGSAYYVAVKRVTAEGTSPYSNIEYFRLKPIWHPAPGTTWQWQLSGTIDTTVEAAAFDVDLDETPQAMVNLLKNSGKSVICYFSAGSWESYRKDAALFPTQILGLPLDGWPNELWLDIRDIENLDPIMTSRLDLAVQKGCDAVEPDNIDGYINNTGFPLTADDQLTYNRWLANQAHIRGLSIGLKNDLDQVAELVDLFDWAINEQCFQYEECNLLLPFIRANKAVFGVEYNLDSADFCSDANAMGFSWLKKDLDLSATRESCL